MAITSGGDSMNDNSLCNIQHHATTHAFCMCETGGVGGEVNTEVPPYLSQEHRDVSRGPWSDCSTSNNEFEC